MNRCITVFIGLVLFLIPAQLVFAAQGTPSTSEDILNYVDDLFRGTSSHAVMKMVVSTAHYTREMTLEAWSRGREDSLVRILKPEKEKGTATLKAGSNIWNYLPKVNRIIKIPSSMMGASWMGSHFTNDDLIKESRMADDYTNSLSFRGERGGQRIIELTLIPKPDAAVVWGKVVVTVTEGSYLPVMIDYYDERKKLTRSMEFSEIRDIGNRKLPTRLRMTPTDKPDEYTEIIYSTIAFDIPLDDAFFSLRNLKTPEAP